MHRRCLLNCGVPKPWIVLGLSGKPERLINVGVARERGLGAVRRFTGGGTVVVDHDTAFASLIMNRTDVGLPSTGPLSPHAVMEWSMSVYGDVFNPRRRSEVRSPSFVQATLTCGSHAQVPHFQLVENDYTFGDAKFGGNAQSACVPGRAPALRAPHPAPQASPRAASSTTRPSCGTTTRAICASWRSRTRCQRTARGERTTPS